MDSVHPVQRLSDRALASPLYLPLKAYIPFHMSVSCMSCNELCLEGEANEQCYCKSLDIVRDENILLILGRRGKYLNFFRCVCFLFVSARATFWAFR